MERAVPVKNNIVFVVRNLSIGGIPRVVIELSKAWAIQEPSDRVYLVLLDDSNRHYDVPEGVIEYDMTRLLNDLLGKVVRAGNKLAPNLFSLVTMGRNTRALNRLGTSLTKETGGQTRFVLCGYGAISAVKPKEMNDTICVGHNLYWSMFKERTGRLADLNRRLMRWAVGPTPTFGISTPIRDGLRREIGISAQELVLLNPVDADRIHELAQAADVVIPDRPYILYLGRLAPEKRVDRIIKAFHEANVAPDAELLIAGSGAEEAQLKALSKGVASKVCFLGPVRNPYPLIAGARALVLASDFEGMPTVLLEARALGTPIITTPAQGAAVEAVEGYSRATILGDGDTAGFSKAIGVALGERPARLDGRNGMSEFSAAASISRYKKGLES